MAPEDAEGAERQVHARMVERSRLLQPITSRSDTCKFPDRSRRPRVCG